MIHMLYDTDITGIIAMVHMLYDTDITGIINMLYDTDITGIIDMLYDTNNLTMILSHQSLYHSNKYNMSIINICIIAINTT